jgi:hypothetical protein
MIAYRLAVFGIVVIAAACGAHRSAPPVAGPSRDSAPASPAPVPLDVPGEETRETRLGRRRDAILAAPPCTPPPPVDTVGWRPAVINGRQLPFRLPPEFQPDPTAEFYHGGARWRAGTRTFLLQNGWWGVDSPSACRAVLPAGEFIVEQSDAEGQRLLTAFPADTVWRPSLLVGGRATTQAELAVLWTILHSLPPVSSLGSRTARVPEPDPWGDCIAAAPGFLHCQVAQHASSIS